MRRLVLVSVFLFGSWAADADVTTDRVQQCLTKIDDKERLNCFDEFAKSPSGEFSGDCKAFEA